MKMRLKACRVQAGMLIKEVAQAIGVSEMTVINWEKGISSLTVNGTAVEGNLIPLTEGCTEYDVVAVM